MRYSSFYFNLFKGTMKKVIAKSYGDDYATKIMKRSKLLYKQIVKDAPNMGKGNPMDYNALFAYAFFSPYLASNKKIKKEVIVDMMRESLYHIKWFFSRTNVNTIKGKLSNSKAVRAYYKWYTKEREEKYPDSFKVDFEGMPYEGACYYRITKCPICSYAKTLGCDELMPMFCELDNVMINLQHGILKREHTIANGESYCDYYILGDHESIPTSEDLKETTEEKSDSLEETTEGKSDSLEVDTEEKSDSLEETTEAISEDEEDIINNSLDDDVKEE